MEVTCAPLFSEMLRRRLRLLTWRRCGRSPADRDKLAEAPCAALREKKQKKQKKTTAINKLLINDPKKQLPLRLSLQREEKRRDEARKKLSC